MEYSQFEGIIVIFSHSHGNFMRLDPDMPMGHLPSPQLVGGLGDDFPRVPCGSYSFGAG